MLRLLPINPAKAIPIISERFRNSYEKAVEEKKEYLKQWHETCEKNFHKSLDHRSFHFKFFEKKHSQAKAFIQDIKLIGQKSLKDKTKSELVGGSKDCDFFCTYSQFEHIIVHT